MATDFKAVCQRVMQVLGPNDEGIIIRDIIEKAKAVRKILADAGVEFQDDSLKEGDYFDPKAFQLVAKIEFDRGDVLVLGNHSTHFHVAVDYLEAMEDGDPKRVQLVKSFRYFVKFKPILEEAIRFATDWALTRTADGE